MSVYVFMSVKELGDKTLEIEKPLVAKKGYSIIYNVYVEYTVAMCFNMHDYPSDPKVGVIDHEQLIIFIKLSSLRQACINIFSQHLDGFWECYSFFTHYKNKTAHRNSKQLTLNSYCRIINVVINRCNNFIFLVKFKLYIYMWFS